jgi:hypothetical protein
MYKLHPIFKSPDDSNIKIWRYLDLDKFTSLIDNRALFFSRSDYLGDKFEGSLTKVDVSCNDPLLIPEIRSLQKQFRECIWINCWHINEYESDAMWRLYSSSNKGIAIQSTVSRLKKSFEGSNYDIMIGSVKYIDYEKDSIPSWNVLSPFLNKRKYFEHERELRALTIFVPTKESSLKGLFVSTNLNTLIENVYVASSSERSFIERLNKIISDHKIDKGIKISAMGNGAIF